jgi:hypothetical protein
MICLSVPLIPARPSLLVLGGYRNPTSIEDSMQRVQYTQRTRWSVRTRASISSNVQQISSYSSSIAAATSPYTSETCSIFIVAIVAAC